MFHGLVVFTQRGSIFDVTEITDCQNISFMIGQNMGDTIITRVEIMECKQIFVM
jgi:hypothetical protein